MSIRPWRDIQRKKTKQIVVGGLKIGGDAPISVQSMTNTLTSDAKATIGGAAAIAVETDTIKVRPGIYIENNPIGLRTDVTVTGEDLRLVIIQAGNPHTNTTCHKVSAVSYIW